MLFRPNATRRGWVAGSPLKTGRVYHGVAALNTSEAGFVLLAIGGSTNYDAANYTHALASVERLVVVGGGVALLLTFYRPSSVASGD